MTGTIFILVLAVTLAFIFGMVTGGSMERRRNSASTGAIDWSRPDFLGVPPPGPAD